MHGPLSTLAAWMLWLTLAAGRAWHRLRHWTCINDVATTVRRWKRWLFVTLTCYIGLSPDTRQRLLPRCCIFDFCQQLCFCACLIPRLPAFCLVACRVVTPSCSLDAPDGNGRDSSRELELGAAGISGGSLTCDDWRSMACTALHSFFTSSTAR